MGIRTTIKDCIVVGAGISGLCAALKLAEIGQDVAVLDKGTGLGGRMATRRIGNATFDHGAQFFTIRSEEFRQVLDQSGASNLLKTWSSEGSATLMDDANNDEHRYICIDGMTGVAKSVASQLEIHPEQLVSRIKWDGDAWEFETDAFQPLYARKLILTPPLPQTLNLLDESNIELGTPLRAELESIKYDKCIALLMMTDPLKRNESVDAMELSGEPISWIADNHQKQISEVPASYTIHFGPKASLELWDSEDVDVMDWALSTLTQFKAESIREYQVHRWKYSKPQQRAKQLSYVAFAPGLIGFAGDAFGGARVEGAALSGIDVAMTLIEDK